MTSAKVVFATQVLLLREKDTAHLSPFRAVTLPSQQAPRQVAIAGERMLVLSEDGIAYTYSTSSSSTIPDLVRVPQPVRSLSCNDTAVLLVTEQGLVYAHGSDPESNGFLAGVTEAERPVLIEELSGVKVTQAGLGRTHAAALDSKRYAEDGKLWTWGYGASGQLGRSCEFPRPQPTLVDSAAVFTGKWLICGSQLTCVLTSGGFLYLFGSIGGHGTVSAVTESLRHLRNSFSRSLSAAISAAKPVSLPGLQNKFVVTATAGDGFLAVLTDVGEVYFFDDCLDIVRLPTQSSSKVTGIGAFAAGLYGIATVDRLLYLWGEPDVCPMTRNLMQTLSSAGHCQLLAWSGKTYSISSQYSSALLKPNGSEIAVLVDTFIETRAFAYLLCELTPYKRSQYISNLMQSFYDSLGKWKSSHQPQRDNLAPFVSRASPIPFAHHDSSDFSVISFEQQEPERSNDQIADLIDIVLKTTFRVGFRRLQEAAESNWTQREAAKSMLIQTLQDVERRTKDRSRKSGFEEIKKYACFRQKQMELAEVHQRKAKDEAVKAIVRSLSAVVGSVAYRSVLEQLIALRASSLRHLRKRESLLQSLLSKRISILHRRLLKYLYLWKTDLVKFHIKADGLRKLENVLRKKVMKVAFRRTESFHREMKAQSSQFAAFLWRRAAQMAKIAQSRYFTRWKDVNARYRMYYQRRIRLLSSGARAFASRFKLFLRKSLYRYVASRLQNAENRAKYLSTFKYPLVFLDMKVQKISRRLCNYAFNRVFQCRKDPKWEKYREALTYVQNAAALRLRPVFSDLSRDSDSSYIKLVVSVVPFVTLLSKKSQSGMKYAWGKLVEYSVSAESAELELETLKSWDPQQSPGTDTPPQTRAAQSPFEYDFGRSPSPQKASLRIPSTIPLSPLPPQSGAATDRVRTHRTTPSNKIQPARDAKPPWRRPSAAVSFASASQVLSPRCIRAQYDKDLKNRLNRHKSGENRGARSTSRPSGAVRTLSPSRFPGSVVTTPSALKSPRVHSPPDDSVYALSTIASPRDLSRGRVPAKYHIRSIIHCCQNLLFTASFRAFAVLKSFPGHDRETERDDEDLEVDWHKRIYLIGSERVRRLLAEMLTCRLRLAWQQFAG